MPLSIKYFSSFLRNVTVGIYERSRLYARNQALHKIKKLSNVHIHDSFQIGEQSGFLLHGKIGQLLIEKNTKCRKFCNFLIYPGAKLILRENVFFNNFCSINCLGAIEIGANSIFGESVKIYDHNHLFELGSTLKVYKDKFKISKVTIGNNCWIGSNVTILMGVTIGDNVIVGANCLVYKSIPSNTIVKHKEELEMKSRTSNENLR